MIIFLVQFSMLTWSFSQNLKPYVLAATISNTSIEQLSTEVEAGLNSGGFQILGTYKPVNEAGRMLIAVTHPALQRAVKKVGGLTGFAAVLRVAITKEGNDMMISYTNPTYWCAAYFTDNFAKVIPEVSQVESAFKNSFKQYPNAKQFGSEKGLSLDKLKNYKYMFGMPVFEDNIRLAKFSSFDAATSKIDENLKAGKKNLVKVYEYEIADKQIKLYGIGLNGPTGENAFMPIIDQSSPKHTAFLPYEILVYQNNVYMLHGRFRIALSFPDLTMGTFMKIVSTPGEIEDLLKMACN